MSPATPAGKTVTSVTVMEKQVRLAVCTTMLL